MGEFAIGTNIGVKRVIGNILQDEKFPGIHIAFGDPYGNHTGAPWKSTTHIDVVGLEFNIWLGGAGWRRADHAGRQVSGGWLSESKSDAKSAKFAKVRDGGCGDD